MIKQACDLGKYIQGTEVNLNRLRTGTLREASVKKLTEWRKEFVMNFEAVSYELSKMNNVLRSGAKNYFGNKDLRFKSSNIFSSVFYRALEFNELFGTKSFHADTRLFYNRLNEFIVLYKVRHEEYYPGPKKKKKKQIDDKLRFMPRRHLLEAQFGNLKVCRLLKIDKGERLEDHLQDVFGPNWENVVKAALYCNVKDVFVEKTSEVVFNEHVDLEEIN